MDNHVYKETAAELGAFIKASPTAFHAVQTIRHILEQNGFSQLPESEAWKIDPGKGYYVVRNHSSIIAFKAGKKLEDYGFHVTVSHSDSPSFKIKENAEIQVNKQYTKLNTEGYGGMLCASWLDRPLSVAGRVIVKEDHNMAVKLVKLDRDLVMIPSLAIHMDRNVNDGHAYNKQKDMLPVFGSGSLEKGSLKKLVAQELQIEAEQIYGMDLFLYNRMEPSVWGAEQEYFSCAQLDDLQCAYASLQGFLKGSNDSAVNVYACFDNEEVGSVTKQGAASTMLYDTLWRVNHSLGKTQETYFRAVANSFMISCDNAHAVHPNFTEKTDENNCVYMNQGIVVKSNAGQKYTSDALSIARFRNICEKANVPVQFFSNRSDMAGGSTLGNIAMTHVSMSSVDIGLPQLAMHSSYETAGVKDTVYLIKAAEVFYKEGY
ncbi:MAG: M18 family aminopeptidase [Blautia sp.]|nr:M18 family aminopeptidase [Blautia sp.]